MRKSASSARDPENTAREPSTYERIAPSADFAHGHEALLAALAERHEVAGVEVHVAQAQLDELRHAQARGVQRLEHGGVARASGRRAIGRREQAVDFLDGEELGQLAAVARQVHLFGRVLRAQPLALEELEQLAQRDEPARLRARRELAVREEGEKIEHVDRAYGARLVHLALGGEAREERQVAPVGLDRRGRELALDPQVVEELLDLLVETSPHVPMFGPAARSRNF